MAESFCKAYAIVERTSEWIIGFQCYQSANVTSALERFTSLAGSWKCFDEQVAFFPFGNTIHKVNCDKNSYDFERILNAKKNATAKTAPTLTSVVGLSSCAISLST